MDALNNRSTPVANDGALQALKNSLRLFTKKRMILLAFTFFYTGVELSFFSGVYSSAIGFTLNLGEQAKRLVGLCGILVGGGEVIGGALFGLLGSKTVKSGTVYCTKNLTNLCQFPCLFTPLTFPTNLFYPIYKLFLIPGRDPIVLLGFLCHTLAYYLVFLNLPDNAPLGLTNEVSYMNPPSAWIAMLCAFLLGAKIVLNIMKEYRLHIM